MNIVILNGSPRNGNTKYAAEVLSKMFKARIDKAEVEVIDVAAKKVSGCRGCDCCQKRGKCVIDDDGIEIIAKMEAADVIVFASPVYWWGISAQLKSVIDRMYASAKMKNPNKKIGVIAIGQDGIDGPRYDLISGQFKCICGFLEWNIIFDKPISAAGSDDLKNNREQVQELENLWKTI